MYLNYLIVKPKPILKTVPVITMLLLDRETFWKTLRGGGVGWAGVGGMAGFIVAACSVYGAVMAFWSSPVLAFYSAVKLPVVFIASTALVAVFNWMVASAFGSGLSFRQTVALTFAAIAVSCWILLALVPVVVFFMLSCAPDPATAASAETDFAYRIVLLTHVLALALAGFAGNAALLNGLCATVRAGCPAAKLFAAWVALFAVVGCQTAWILRPFVGTPDYEVVFMRKDALNDNFFQWVFLKHLPAIFK